MNEMVGPQEQLSGSLAIIELPKLISFFFGNLFISNKVSLKESLRISHGKTTTIRCPCENISSREYWISSSHTHRFIVSSPIDSHLTSTPPCPTPALVSNIFNVFISNPFPQVPFSFNHVPLSLTSQLTTRALHFSSMYGIRMPSQHSKPTRIHSNTIYKSILQQHNNRNTSTFR